MIRDYASVEISIDGRILDGTGTHFHRQIRIRELLTSLTGRYPMSVHFAQTGIPLSYLRIFDVDLDQFGTWLNQHERAILDKSVDGSAPIVVPRRRANNVFLFRDGSILNQFNEVVCPSCLGTGHHNHDYRECVVGEVMDT